MKFNIKNYGTIEGNINNPSRILRQIGEMMRSRIQNAFTEQARGKFLWKERKTPNIMGVLSDLEKGATIKDRRFDSRPALIDTSNLLKSFGIGKGNVELPTKYRVEVGTPVEYAPKLNVGGVSEKKVTAQMKENLGKYLKKSRNKKYRESLGWLFRRDSVKVNIPTRPFAILTETDIKDSIRLIKGEFIKK